MERGDGGLGRARGGYVVAQNELGTGYCRGNGILICYVSSLQSSVKNVFIRGSVVRYVHLPANAVDTPLLEDATRRGKDPEMAHVRR